MKDKKNYTQRIGAQVGDNAYAKSIWCNRIRLAMKHVYRFARENRISLNRLKQKELIYQYAQSLDKSESFIIAKNAKQWLYDYYIDNLKSDNSDCFYLSKEWRIIRLKILNKYGYICMKCGSTELMHVDHIKPRSLYKHLELCEDNLQVLCQKCNIGKSNRSQIDYRPRTYAY